MDSCRQCGCAVLPRTEMLRLGSRRPRNSWSSSGTKSVSTFAMRKKSSSRFSSGTSSRRLLPSAMHASNTCSSRGSLANSRSEEHTSELQSRPHLVCRLLLEKKKKHKQKLTLKKITNNKQKK